MAFRLLVLLCAALAAFSGPLARDEQSDVIHAANLPEEARTTLRAIQAGGPFPYARDGTVFRNRERLLPLKPRNYYREYTVPTPGVPHRGARRIVAGQGAEYYYTHDHYRSFRRILQ